MMEHDYSMIAGSFPLPYLSRSRLRINCPSLIPSLNIPWRQQYLFDLHPAGRPSTRSPRKGPRKRLTTFAFGRGRRFHHLCREADCCDCRVQWIGPRVSPLLKAIEESRVYLPRGGRGCDLRRVKCARTVRWLPKSKAGRR